MDMIKRLRRTLKRKMLEEAKVRRKHALQEISAQLTGCRRGDELDLLPHVTSRKVKVSLGGKSIQLSHGPFTHIVRACWFNGQLVYQFQEEFFDREMRSSSFEITKTGCSDLLERIGNVLEHNAGAE